MAAAISSISGFIWTSVPVGHIGGKYNHGPDYKRSKPIAIWLYRPLGGHGKNHNTEQK
jgi:hypothetical protein